MVRCPTIGGSGLRRNASLCWRMAQGLDAQHRHIGAFYVEGACATSLEVAAPADADRLKPVSLHLLRNSREVNGPAVDGGVIAP